MKIKKEALSLLEANNWPGNVRELRHCVERAVILSDSQSLGPEDFSGLGSGPDTSLTVTGQTLDEVEKAMIEGALATHQGNISKAAKELGLTRTSLYRRIEKYEL